MFKNRWAVATAVAGVIFLCLVSLCWTPRTAATPAGSDADQNAFKGKVLLVRSSFGAESYVLEGVKVRQFGNNPFLVGKALEASGGRTDCKGKTMWLNMATVTSIIECDDAEEAKKLLKATPGGIGVPGIAIEAVPAAPPPNADVPKTPPAGKP
jgi:hypothetical protein